MPTQIAELIPKLPEPVRALPRTAIWAYGTATASLRPLPTALIIGAQKAGTSALYAWLRDHPEQQNLNPEVDETIEQVLHAWSLAEQKKG